MQRPAALPDAIARPLLAVRRRRRGLAVAQALSWALLGAAALAGASVLIPSAPEGWLRGLRWAAWAWVVLWLVVPLMVWIVPPWRRTGTLLQVARAVDDRSPAARDSLLVAVDLAAGLDNGSLAGDGETERLARRHLEQASAHAAAVDAAELLPVSSLGRLSLLGPAFAVAVLAGSLLQPGPVATGLALLFGPIPLAEASEEEAEAEDERVTLLLRNIIITLTPPAYSGREELRLDGTSGDFQALPGTTVRLEADATGGGRAVHLRWVDGAGRSGGAPEADGSLGPSAVDVPGELDGEHVSVEFTTRGKASYRLLVERGVGREPLQTRVFHIDALPDDPPSLEVAGPPSDARIEPNARLKLDIRAGDDFGLSKVELVVESRGRAVGRTRLAAPSGARSWEDSIDWSPLDDPDTSGGELTLVVEAWDNDTVNGPKLTRSRPLELYVPTPRDHHRRVQALKQELLTRSLAMLADLLVTNNVIDTRTARDELIEQYEHQNRLATGVFATASQLAEAMMQDSLERRDVFMGIGLLIENLSRRWRAVTGVVDDRIRGNRRSSSFVPRPDIVAFANARTETITELERIVLDLDAFISLHTGEELLQEVAEAENSAASLADLLRQAQDGKPVDAAMQKALQELAEQLAELARQLAERSAGPDEGFLNDMPAELGEDVLSEIQKLMQEGKFEEAAEKLQAAMEALAQMNEQLRKEQETMAGSQSSQQAQKELQELLDEVAELEKQQQAVIDETEQLQEAAGSGDSFSREEQQQLAADMEELIERIQALPPEALPARARGAVRQWSRFAENTARRMREAFQGSYLDEAQAYGETTAGYLQEMETDLGEMAGVPEAQRGAAMGQLAEAEKLAQDIVERMKQGEEQGERSRQRAAQAGRSVAQQQDGVGQNAGKARQRLEGMGGSAFNPVAGRESLDGARQSMQASSQRLGEGRPGKALNSERDALQQLQSLRQSLEQSQEAMQQGGRMGMGQQGQQMAQGQQGSTPWDRAEGWQDPDGGEVEMSRPEDFVTPEAFRALLQEGAAGDAPERYRPLNGSYYEELVR